ncbi:MAG: hydantoinase/oxoprolinase family protein, partial [Acetobacteraceae bacterium]
TLPTITDANLVLGYLNPAYFNGGAMALDRAAAGAAIERDIARPLRMSLEAAAWGIHSIANANMERAMRIVSIERGRDPRRYALVAFGGAGPLHACRLARSLEVPRVIVPRGAGVGSALGLLVADKKVDFGMTRVLRLNEATPESVADIFAPLEERVTAEVRRMDRGSGLRLQRSASMRYAGQGYEIRVELPDGVVGRDYVVTALAAFHSAYGREYGYNDPGAAVEVSDWFVVATIAGSHVDVGFRFDHHERGGDPVVGERDAYFPEMGGMIQAKVVDRYALAAGHRIWGPALVEERECTTVILPGDGVSVSAAGNLVIDIKARSAAA